MRYKKREKKERDSQKERDEQRERDRQRKREIEKQDINKTKNEIEKHRCKERKLKGSDIDKCRDLEVWGRMKQCLMFIQARMESQNSRAEYNMIKQNIH